jgi:hypothetical protein
MDKFFERYEELVISNHHLKHEVKDLQREIIDLRAEIFSLKRELCEVKEEAQEPDDSVIASAAEQAYIRAIERTAEDRKNSSDVVYAAKETRTATGCTAKQAKEAVDLAKRNYEVKLKAEQDAPAQAQVQPPAQTAKVPHINIPGLPPEIIANYLRK